MQINKKIFLAAICGFMFILLSNKVSAFFDTYPKNPNIDIIHYSFALNLYDTTDRIEGVTNIRLKFKKENVTILRLDLVNQSALLKGKGMVVLSIQDGEKPMKFIHRGDSILINLLPYSSVNKEANLTIRYQGIPADALRIGPTKFGDRSFFNENWPNRARHWLPTVDHPYEKATSEFIVTAPDHYQVVSNGLLMEESNLGAGRKLTHWKQSVPVSSWLYVLGVAKFAVQYVDSFDGRSIQTWVYPQNREAGFYDFAETTHKVLSFYTDYIGPFAYEKLANIQSPSVGGGMETSSAIFYGEDLVNGKRDKRSVDVIIHEIAHQWFGNAVTEYDWNDVWLSEGFATYFTMRYIKHADGHDAFIRELISSRKNVIKMSNAEEEYHVVHDNLVDMTKVTSGLTYQKGAWILNMLCNYIGEEAFHKGIRDYYQRYFNSNATTADLRGAFERASGKDLRQFFQQWLNQGGHIKLKGGWSYNAITKMIEIELQQVQSENHPFNMPLEIGILPGDNKPQKIEVIQLDKRKINFSIPSETMPKEVVLDPGTRLLAEWDFSQIR